MARMHGAQPRYVQPDTITQRGPTISPYRGFPNAYEVNALGTVEPLNPSCSWSRGELVRAANPMLTGHLLLPPPVPMYDPTILAHPEWWGVN